MKDKIRSLTELREICEVAGEWRETSTPAPWSPPHVLELVMRG